MLTKSQEAGADPQSGTRVSGTHQLSLAILSSWVLWMNYIQSEVINGLLDFVGLVFRYTTVARVVAMGISYSGARALMIYTRDPRDAQAISATHSCFRHLIPPEVNNLSRTTVRWWRSATDGAYQGKKCMGVKLQIQYA